MESTLTAETICFLPAATAARSTLERLALQSPATSPLTFQSRPQPAGICSSPAALAGRSTLPATGPSLLRRRSKSPIAWRPEPVTQAVDINLPSNKVTGTAISVSSSGQLLALLSGLAPGPGGSIKLTSAGGAINVNGTVKADRGTVEATNNGASGIVNP